MNKLVRSCLTAAMLLSTAGCYKNTVSTGLPAGGEVHAYQAPFLLWGLAGDETIDTNKLCPQGVAKIEEYMGPKQAGLYCITCGIYSPIQVDITCSSGQAWSVRTSDDSGLALVSELDGSSQAPGGSN